MRDVLFRGKNRDGVWQYGSLISSSYGSAIIDKNDKITVTISVSPDTVGEYIGLTDKTGEKIFEGDILSAHLDTVFPEIESRFIVKFEHGAFLLMDKKGLFCDFGGDFEKQFEVIGNMYDNPELWKWSDDK